MRHQSILVAAAALAILGVACSTNSEDERASAAANPAEHDSAVHHSADGEPAAQSADSAFAALQQRGARAMGVDQYTSTHTFEPRPDGGRITFQRDAGDSAGIAQIRAHLEEITRSFTAGDFSTPFAVHDRAVPGTDVMTAKRALITYAYAPLPHGGEVALHTADSAAVAAIHRFLAFQRQDHRAGGG